MPWSLTLIALSGKSKEATPKTVSEKHQGLAGRDGHRASGQAGQHRIGSFGLVGSTEHVFAGMGGVQGLSICQCWDMEGGLLRSGGPLGLGP